MLLRATKTVRLAGMNAIQRMMISANEISVNSRANLDATTTRFLSSALTSYEDSTASAIQRLMISANEISVNSRANLDATTTRFLSSALTSYHELSNIARNERYTV